MDSNTITLLDKYNEDILKLDLTYKKISSLLDLIKFRILTTLYCYFNEITQLDNLLETLIKLFQ